MLALALAAAPIGAAAPASAASTQEAGLQDDNRLLADPGGTLDELRVLGVRRVRVFVEWAAIAPNAGSGRRPAGFDASDPAAYPPSHWVVWDNVVRAAAARGIGLDFDLNGNAPLWATAPGAPPPRAQHGQWEPSPREFRAFVHAVAERYSGAYDPSTDSLSPGSANDLPPVGYWSVWNEPDYGPHLAPQSTHHSTVERAAVIYRNLLDAAWTALQATGHRGDTFLFGELAPRGANDPGIFSGTKPLRFLRALYCVGSSYRPLSGRAATLRGCPAGGGRPRAFRGAHPALFAASGIADHPYSQASAPDHERAPDRDFTSLAELGQLERAIDRLQRGYGSHRRLPIYLTEYGYLTSPPRRSSRQRPIVSPATAAYYLNWAEYIAWRNPRVASFTQYLLVDPVAPSVTNDHGGYASGLRFFGGARKPGYDAYRLPVYLPASTARVGRRLEVWGCVRPGGYASQDSGQAQEVAIQFQRGSHGPFQTLQAVPITNAGGYFDVRLAFPASGTVRLEWISPAGIPTHSRAVRVVLH